VTPTEVSSAGGFSPDSLIEAGSAAAAVFDYTGVESITGYVVQTQGSSIQVTITY
jgi:hypothetical protein